MAGTKLLQQSCSRNWLTFGSELICAYTDAKAIDGQTFALVGIWSDHGDYTGNGVRFSSDGGQTWAETTWVPKGVEVTARYGYWLDSNTGYVTGGTFPTDDSTIATKMYQRNEFIRRSRSPASCTLSDSCGDAF